jgi:alkylhydroperoxidase/carboxymuconolactone decarboxylase family protein YurZ
MAHESEHQSFRESYLGLPEGSDTKSANGPVGAFFETALHNVWQGVWEREGLDQRSRAICTLSLLTAGRATDQLELHINAALRGGLLTQDEIVEVIIQVAAYNGYACAGAAIRILDTILREATSRGE